MLFCVQCGTCPVCRKSLPAADDTVVAGSELLSSPSHGDDTETEQLENLPVVTVDMETAADSELPVLSLNSVIDDVEYFEIDARLQTMFSNGCCFSSKAVM